MRALQIWEDTRQVMGEGVHGYPKGLVLAALREERDLIARQEMPRLPCCEDAYQHVRAVGGGESTPRWALVPTDSAATPLFLEGECPFCQAPLRPLLFAPSPAAHYQLLCDGSCVECGETAANCYCLPGECAWRAAGEPSAITPTRVFRRGPSDSEAGQLPTVAVPDDKFRHLVDETRSQETSGWTNFGLGKAPTIPAIRAA